MSPEKAWMNDPNGMVYYEGEYHLFYQHHPNAPTFGPDDMGACGKQGFDPLGASADRPASRGEWGHVLRKRGGGPQ